MRVLVATTGFSGHVLPLAPFVEACVRAGHDVRVAVPRARQAVAATLCVPVLPLPDHAPEAQARIVARAAPLRADEAHAVMVAEGFARAAATASLGAAQHVVDMWRPELVLHETLEFAAALAAERRGIPRVRVALGLAGGHEAELAAAARGLADLRAELGLAPDPDGQALLDEPWLSLTPPGLDDEAPSTHGSAHRFRDARAARRPAPLPDWWDGSEAPLVHLSFGSIAGSRGLPYFPALYRASADALAGLPVRILVTVGRDRDPADLGPVPANVRVERWVPQQDVLCHAAAAVGHGGYGSVLGALAHGVPLVVVPLFGGDQWGHARRVEAIGAGVALTGEGVRRPFEPPAPEVLAGLPGALRAVLDDPRYRAAARRIADEVSALPPADAAVEVLEAVATGAAAWA